MEREDQITHSIKSVSILATAWGSASPCCWWKKNGMKRKLLGCDLCKRHGVDQAILK